MSKLWTEAERRLTPTLHVFSILLGKWLLLLAAQERVRLGVSGKCAAAAVPPIAHQAGLDIVPAEVWSHVDAALAAGRAYEARRNDFALSMISITVRIGQSAI